MKLTGDTIQVRKGEELSPEPLRQFLRENMADMPNQELVIEQFGAGHSNLTYLIRAGEWEAVLRRGPHGPVAPKAHDMHREYRLLKSLYPFYSVTPKPYLFSDDKSIAGAPFFLMERRKGIVLDTDFPDNIAYKPLLGQKVSQLMADKLADLHAIDYTKTNLVHMSKPDGFMERQVQGWINRYERSKTSEIPGINQLTRWLQINRPKSQEPTIIHYDYKLNNAMFSNDFNEMTGLFDWEMTTVGDPLADLGAALSYWMEADDPDQLKNGLGKPPVTIMEGFYSRREFLQEYALKSGRDVSAIHYYLTFAYFKLAVIMQQIYYRYVNGQTNDKRFASLNVYTENLTAHALASTKGV